VEESPEPADGSSRRALVCSSWRRPGDADTAETLYGSVVEWSQTPRPRQVRELLFVVLAGSPGAALWGLARLAAARGDDDAANNPQAHAAAMAAGDRRGSTSPGHGSRLAAAPASLAGKRHHDERAGGDRW
jgi:hypothetical protein